MGSEDQFRAGLTRRVWRRRHGAAFGVGVVLLGLTAVVFWRMMAWADKSAEARFAEHALRMRDHFVSQMRSHEAVLRAARAFVESSEHVSREEWAHFTRVNRIGELHPELLGLSYVERVLPEGLDAFVERARADGAPDFAVRSHPDADRGDGPHYVVLFHEPESVNRSAWGLDVTTLGVNRAAFDDSAEADEVRATRGFHLYQLPDPEGLGIVMTLPVRTGGSGEVSGWIAAPIVVDNAFLSWAGIGWEGAWVRVAEVGNGERTLFESGPAGEHGEPISLAMAIGGRDWVFQCAPYGHRVLAGERGEAWVVLVAGALVSVLVSMLLWLAMRTGDRARRLAYRMTKTLAESEARQSLLAQRAQDASEAKTLFLANMSHELRTPLTAVLGYADRLAEEGGLGEGQAEAVRAIRRNGWHLLALVNDVLDLTGAETGLAAQRYETVHVASLVEDAVATARPAAQRKGLRVEGEVEGGAAVAAVLDATRVRQVLNNLMHNAVKFSESGSVRLVARRSGERLHLSVTDSGPGIEPSARGRIFEPFTQGDERHSRSQGGAGLGLAVSRRLARRMGGDVTVESEVGKGSVFTLWLPLVPGEAGGGVAEARAEASATPLHGRVLVAEDSEDSQRLLGWMLRRAGLRVESATDGAQAVRAVVNAGEAGEPFDLVLMDVQMPVVDGLEATRELRRRGFRGAIVALTAHAMPEDRRRCLAAGCDDYRSKPIEREELIRVVAEHLGAASAA